jgi:hypothetical protein
MRSTAGSVLVAGYAANVAAFTFVGEVILIVWLLTRGAPGHGQPGERDRPPQ